VGSSRTVDLRCQIKLRTAADYGLSSPHMPGDPLVIGGTGGSGTRVVAAIVRRGGRFMGARPNASDDGRVIALARNQHQVERYGEIALGPGDDAAKAARTFAADEAPSAAAQPVP
jgi:hypothetical protein